MVRRCSKKRYVGPRATTAARQARTARKAAVWKAKASRLRVTKTLARVSLPCPKLCSRLYPQVLSTLKVSFSIPACAATGVTQVRTLVDFQHVRSSFRLQRLYRDRNAK